MKLADSDITLLNALTNQWTSMNNTITCLSSFNVPIECTIGELQFVLKPEYIPIMEEALTDIRTDVREQIRDIVTQMGRSMDDGDY